MGEKLRDIGGAVQWNTELVALAQEADRVVATLKHADGTRRRLAAKWVAGCDGAHSAVRELNGITFPGAPYEHIFFVADTEVTGPMVPDEVNAYVWKMGFHLLFPMRGRDHWRVVGIVPPELRGRDDLAFDAVVPSVRAAVGDDLSFKSCSWFSTYRIHHRAAARFRAGRCFVLGDAAHIHSPVGAQGMNTGLQDAYNLAWKLALVVKGRAGAALLNSYEEERIPVARRLLNTTDRAFKLIVSDSWLAGMLRVKVLARVVAFAMARKSIQAFAFRTISQTGIHYRDVHLSQNLGAASRDAPRAGDRFPWMKLDADGRALDTLALDDTKFNLLVVGQNAPSADVIGCGDLLAVHTVPTNASNDRELARCRVPHPSFYLLRPDGHVGLSGGCLEVAAIGRYMTERVGLMGGKGM
jgi:2-polyprenyl-6-methoxyphenol hydroxylase-like FAD-dependent oxidoreductase